MRCRAFLLAATALSIATPALAQVSVPLPRPGAPMGPATIPAPAAPPPNPPLPGAGSTSVPLPGANPAPPTVPIGKYGRPDINPYDRDISLTVPLTYRNRSLGDLPVVLTKDDRFVVETDSFLKLIGTLLNDAAKAKLAKALAGKTSFENADIAPTGISLEYDPSSLSVVVLRIDPTERLTEDLFPTPHDDSGPVDLVPAKFSAFVNLSVVENKDWGSYSNSFEKPALYFNGASRLGPVVLEFDAQLAQDFGFSDSPYRFDRNYVRLVYDQPDEYRRWYLGDLTPEIRGEQTYVQMGGIGVTREKIRFDQFRLATLQGDRNLVLQQASTVDVYRNGSLLRQFRLDAGTYNLNSLPLLTGSNDVQIQVHNDNGISQTINYNSYLDPIDLQPGDYEYAAYVGKLSDRIGQSPVYNGPVGFTGFYRKAFLNAPAVGVGLQLSADSQVVTGQTQYVLPNSGRVELDGGLSNSKGYGFGYSAGVGYDQVFDRSGLVDSFSIETEYLSRRYGGLGYIDPDNSNALSVSVNYSRAITREISVLLSGSYLNNRGTTGDSYRVDLSTYYNITPSWSIRGGIDYTYYGNTDSSLNGFGFNVSLVYQPNYSDRAEALYDSSTDTEQLSYIHSSSNQIGSVGYGAIVGRDLGTTDAQAFASYTGNRFDASLSQVAYGTSFGTITDQQVTSLRVGTTLAFADGAFGIGRQVSDSFAILYPNSNLKGHPVVAGQSISENDYMSESGPLGGALNSYLTSYITQSVQYDVKNPPPGYDVGAGVVRVRPTYHSGYKIKVGADAFASAVGTLYAADGKPVSLAGGSAVALDKKDEKSVPFFTNSVGRFALQDLKPGVRYHVQLFSPDVGFEFTVPADTTGLVNLGNLKLPADQ